MHGLNKPGVCQCPLLKWAGGLGGGLAENADELGPAVSRVRVPGACPPLSRHKPVNGDILKQASTLGPLTALHALPRSRPAVCDRGGTAGEYVCLCSIAWATGGMERRVLRGQPLALSGSWGQQVPGGPLSRLLPVLTALLCFNCSPLRRFPGDSAWAGGLHVSRTYGCRARETLCVWGVLHCLHTSPGKPTRVPRG